jgi:hypothetical protein
MTELERIKEFVQLLFDVPPKHESEPVPFHKGWELCAREVYAFLNRKVP